ncbi:M20/M25/M40 family metallo-hydrolase [Chitinimonas sp. PSY-7]|uniref:M20/M25/M40 family metallo-hydrolase n=1 Tax=Chitinimonas sp. PSY-7 TaxID=3459088 RepID=UPI0040402146
MNTWIKHTVTAVMLSFASYGQAADKAVIAPHYRQLLQQLVDINTDTRNVAGLEDARKMLIPEFEALGMVLTRHRLKQDGREVLAFEVPNAQPQILFVGHIDTVFASSSKFRQLTEQADRLVGPGVIDMKGGVVLMLNVLAQLKQTGQLDKVRIVLNDDEEIGSPWSKETLRSLAKGIPFGLVFEPGLSDGAVVSSQSGVRWIKVTSSGKAAHAGLEPENGIDACRDIALKIKQITELAKPDRGLTINPGVVEGGSKPNVVCENASVTFDIRFRSPKDWEELSTAIELITKHSDVFNERLQKGPQTTAVQIAELPPLSEGQTTQLRKLLEASASTLGQSVQARPVGYGSDGNHLAVTGMQLLVGLGPFGGGMHSEQEFMRIDAYANRLDLITHMVGKLLNQGMSHSQALTQPGVNH